MIIVKKWYLLYPDENFSMNWQIIISNILIISVFLTPYQLAFPEIQEKYEKFNTFLVFVDGMFYADIILNFF